MDAVRDVCIYESRSVLLVTGLCATTNRHLILEVKRPTVLTEDAVLAAKLYPNAYTQSEIDELVATFQLTKVVSNACCLYGFVRLVESYYAVCVTKATPVASLHGHTIYAVADTFFVPVTYKARNTMEETRYKDTLAGCSLRDGFYFSYTYDVASAVEHNWGPAVAQRAAGRWRDVYAWNHFALQPLLGALATSAAAAAAAAAAGNSDGGGDDAAPATGGAEARPPTAVNAQRWAVPVIHGYVEQRTVRLARCGAAAVHITSRSLVNLMFTHHLSPRTRSLCCAAATASNSP